TFAMLADILAMHKRVSGGGVKGDGPHTIFSFWIMVESIYSRPTIYTEPQKKGRWYDMNPANL
ncbi:hypothetical protein TorRG33x02_258280, partial [Trema orientale]